MHQDFNLKNNYKGCIMKKQNYNIPVPMLFISMVLLLFGCTTTPKEEPATDKRQQQVEQLEAKKSELQLKIKNPDSVDEEVALKSKLESTQHEINRLNAGKPIQDKSTDEEDGFKSTKEKKKYYGPLGIVLNLTEWILVKLYIIHET